MQDNPGLIPDLFKTEYSKIVAVLCNHYGYSFLQEAQDIASDTFLKAAQTWGSKKIPKNPTAWLYTVAKNRALDNYRRKKVFNEKVKPEVTEKEPLEVELDYSTENIDDSQLKMMFWLANESLKPEAQIGLALRILCGFGIDEIASAFLTNKETINKRLQRAKRKLKEAESDFNLTTKEIKQGQPSVLNMIYLLFNEGYYTTNKNKKVKSDLCYEALRLALLVAHHPLTGDSKSKALVALICFHSSRLDAREQEDETDIILFQDQDKSKWNKKLIEKGNAYMNLSASGRQASRFHLEAMIAYWHTQEDSDLKWQNILFGYNLLLQQAYSPMAALNRTYALSQVYGAEKALEEALKIELKNNHLYHVMIGTLYKEVDVQKALDHFLIAHKLTNTNSEQKVIERHINELGLSNG